MKALREIVADHMHPWLEPGGRVPIYRLILEAADRLIEGLRSEGYEIVRTEAEPYEPFTLKDLRK
jgi:hypothetical protein